MYSEGQDVGQAPGGGQPAAGDDSDSTAERLGVSQDVRAEEHGAALIAQVEDQMPHVPAAHRIEPGHRLVQEKHLRIVEQRLRDAHALDHAFRELPELQTTLGADARAVQQRRHPGVSIR